MRHIWKPLLAAVALTFVSGACAGNRELPKVDITSPANGVRVKGNVLTLDLKAVGIDIVKADGDTSGRTGHYHVFIDKKPVKVGEVIPKGPGIIHSADNPVKVYGLTTGKHTAVVVMGDGAHTRRGSASKTIHFTVAGPSVHASVPATNPAGQPVAVTVQVQGVKLVKADGDTSGKTGHLHLFIDRDPTPANEAIPKPADGSIIHTADTTVQVPGLAKGEHTIWVVLGNGAHDPWKPPVMDKLTVTVS
jgi:hypothetical protein